MTTISRNLFLDLFNKKFLQRKNLSPISFHCASLCEKCPYSEFFWSIFPCIWTEYRKILRISPYLIRIRENMDKKNSEYGHFHAVFHYINYVRVRIFTGKYGSEKTRILVYFTQCYAVPKNTALKASKNLSYHF